MSFKEHFGFSIQYDDEDKKAVIKVESAPISLPLLAIRVGSNMMSHLCGHHSALSQVKQGVHSLV